MKLAFIGMGNMAYAILKGGCDRGFFNPAHVSAYDINTVRLAEVAAETGITAAVSARVNVIISINLSFIIAQK